MRRAFAARDLAPDDPRLGRYSEVSQVVLGNPAVARELRPTVQAQSSRKNAATVKSLEELIRANYGDITLRCEGCFGTGGCKSARPKRQLSYKKNNHGSTYPRLHGMRFQAMTAGGNRLVTTVSDFGLILIV